jgi:hypothetical protein
LLFLPLCGNLFPLFFCYSFCPFHWFITSLFVVLSRKDWLCLKVFPISFNVCHLFYYCQSINGGRICCVTPISVDLLLHMNL